MTTYSLTISDVTLPELHAMLGVFLEATRSPRWVTEKDKVISHPGERSSQKRSHGESCAYCDKPIDDANGRQFCSSKCQCDFVNDSSKAKNAWKFNDLSGKENIPSIGQSAVKINPVKLQGIIRAWLAGFALETNDQ